MLNHLKILSWLGINKKRKTYEFSSTEEGDE